MNISTVKSCFIPVILSILFFFPAKANTIRGRVSDEQGAPLAFANVFIKGTTNGTTTNADGNYKLEAASGKYEIVFKYIGYKTLVKEINLNVEEIIFDVVLMRENYSLKEVVITAGEDPAYAIIRKAIEKRKFYLEQVDEVSSDVYIKGLQRLLKWPKKILGQEVMVEQFLDTITKIIYLSESVSKYYFKKPDEVHEEMISSKVSGNSRAFSWNQASDMQFNFYENLMETGIAPRGVVSPLSSNALFYYKFRLEGTFIENDITVNKISVIPKRKNDPVYRGTIYIQDSTWRIHSLDLMLTKDAQLMFVDTLAIKQVFVPVGDDNSVWMAASSRFDFHFAIFGFEGNGNYVGVFSNYNLHPAKAEKKPAGEVMKVQEGSNKKDSSYWAGVRPVPLTLEEQTDYHRKDSAQAVKESKPYLDSLDRKSNKIKPGKILLTGYEYRQRYKKSEFNFSPLIENIQFNTVEGFTLGMRASYIKNFDEDRIKRIRITPFVKYGVENKTWSSTVAFEYKYRQNYFTVEGGKNSMQYNNQNPISAFINTSYSLFGEKNYMKIFSNAFGKISYRGEIINGINYEIGGEYAERTPLVNHTDYTFVDKENREYTSNNPLNPVDDSPAFEKNQIFSGNINLRFRIKQKYISRPNQKFIIGSKYPTFILNYKKARDDISSSDVSYDLLKAGVNDEMNLGLLGSFSYEVVYGNFLSNKKMFFMDSQHFNGNQTIFSNFDLRKFNILDYYSNSTNNEFVEAHAEQNFRGFIFNKIPLLRKLKLDEIVGFHFLHVPDLENHFEISAGISKLNIFRFEFVAGFTKNQKTETGIRISLVGL